MSVLLEERRSPARNPGRGARPVCSSQPSLLRGIAQTAVISLCVLLIARTFFVETFYIPTGSMAPNLLGEHRVCTCPACGNRVAVGKHPSETDHGPTAGLYRKAFCPWCGNGSLRLVEAPLKRGDLILVNKLAYWGQSPRRWDLAVFYLWGEYIIKRILGLPGDEILIDGGDLYVNDVLSRKSWQEMEALRVLLFDQSLAGPNGWSFRWRDDASVWDGAPPVAHPVLRLDALTKEVNHIYRNSSPLDGKCSPLVDEQAYNGSLHPTWETVHDFLVETEVTIEEGSGVFSITLCDGADQVTAHLPVGKPGQLRITRRTASEDPTYGEDTLANREGIQLPRSFRLQWAFVDRRVLLRIDGREMLPPIDLPMPVRRVGVDRPLVLSARGVNAICRNLKLYRDVHYTQGGVNGVHGQPVRLGAGEYFVLGDNSGRSQDSRYWPNRGVVPENALIGRALWQTRAAP